METLDRELEQVIIEQRRKVINYDDSVIVAQLDAEKEKRRLASFEQHLADLRRGLGA